MGLAGVGHDLRNPREEKRVLAASHPGHRIRPFDRRPLMIGSTLAHYTILEPLGAGGMGAVYRAHDTRLGRDVALKVLPPELLDDPVARARLVREARTASQLNHPHICVIHEVGEADGMLYIAMELVPGSTLQAMIPPRGLPTASVLDYGSQIAAALTHAHEHNVIHRDLKASNIVVTREGQAKVLDFGLARLAEGFADPSEQTTATLTEPGMSVGTPKAMAPEVLRGESPGDVRSDLWSLGIVLYEMSCGRIPFAGRTLGDLCAAIIGQPFDPLPPRVPARLRKLIGRCLEKDPARRIESAAEVQAELAAMRDSGPRESGRRGQRQRQLLVATAVLCGLAGATFLVRAVRLPGADRGQVPAAAAAALRGLAVLPLENLSADPTQTYFADGITEELIGNLGQIGNLRVISRNSVMRFGHSTLALGAIAKELGVDLVVTGSVRAGEDSVRIRAHLIQVSPERELWSGAYTREARQVLALENDLAREIAERIAVRITPLEQARMAQARPVVPAAYEEYLRGRFHWNQRTPEGMRQAIAHFKSALAIDPGLAVAHAGLADAYGRLNLYTGRLPRETFPVAREAAEAALRLDNGLAEAHTSLAAVALYYDRDWPRAREEFLRAIELRPNYATAHHWYSIYLRDQGQFAAALGEAKQALELDPLAPILRVNLADTHFYARQFKEAIRLHREVIARDSTFAPAYYYLGFALDQAGQPAQAVAAIQRARALTGTGDYGLGGLGYVEARAGNTAAARRAKQELVQLSAGGIAVSFDLALIHLGLGETDEALGWLERAEEERASLNDLAVDPRFDPLRREVRFRRLLGRIGLPTTAGEAGKTAQNRR